MNLNNLFLPGYTQEEPDVFTPSGIISAANIPVSGITIQQQKKSPIPDDLYKKLTERQLQSFKDQAAGVKEFEGSIQDPKNIDPALAVVSGLSDFFSGTNYMQGLQGQKSVQEKQAREDRFRLQQMKQNLTDKEIDMLKNQFQYQQESDQLKAQMGLAREKIAAEREKSSKPPELKDWQVQSATYGRRLAQAENVFSDLENQGYDRGTFGEGAKDLLSAVPGVGHLTSENLKRQQQAERNFITATLRKESGAAISASEFKNAEQQYFPRAGDSPEVLAQKRANRQQVVEGMKLGAGPAWSQLPQVASEVGAGAMMGSKKPAPKAGEIVNGYKFKGGNPADKNSWEKQ